MRRGFLYPKSIPDILRLFPRVTYMILYRGRRQSLGFWKHIWLINCTSMMGGAGSPQFRTRIGGLWVLRDARSGDPGLPVMRQLFGMWMAMAIQTSM
jgi:hypothetical protein